MGWSSQILFAPNPDKVYFSINANTVGMHGLFVFAVCLDFQLFPMYAFLSEREKIAQSCLLCVSRQVEDQCLDRYLGTCWGQSAQTVMGI